MPQGIELASIYDHHAVTYEYPDGVKLFFSCRQQPGTTADVSEPRLRHQRHLPP